jgi:hypothetical protein
MRLVRSLRGAALILLLAGCGAAPGPSGAPASASAVPPDSSDRPDPSAVVVDQLGGPWRFSPVVVDDAHVAIVSDACAAKSRETLGQDVGDLPTALVDARGEHFVTVIMADDLTAIECLARLSDDGASATVDSVDRLSAPAVAPVEKSAITVASVIHQDDRSGGRTVAFGRVGPDADAAKAGFGDNSTVLGSKAEGWWAMWWPGTVRANSYAATDRRDLAVGSATPPAGEVEARVGPASWWVDQTRPAPAATSTTIHALIVERACASGQSPADRIDPPTIEPDDHGITVTFWVRKRPGAQDCQGNDPFGLDIKLPEPLGARLLYDGSEAPPRDVTKGPPG